MKWNGKQTLSRFCPLHGWLFNVFNLQLYNWRLSIAFQQVVVGSCVYSISRHMGTEWILKYSSNVTSMSWTYKFNGVLFPLFFIRYTIYNAQSYYSYRNTKSDGKQGWRVWRYGVTWKIEQTLNDTINDFKYNRWMPIYINLLNRVKCCILRRLCWIEPSHRYWGVEMLFVLFVFMFKTIWLIRHDCWMQTSTF